MSLFVSQKLIHCLSGYHLGSVKFLNRVLKAHVVAFLIKSKKQILFYHLDLCLWKNVKFLVLNELCCNSILPIQKLNNISLGVSYCLVIGNHNVLQGLDQSSLNVARLGSLNCCVDNTFSSSHCVKIKLFWCEAFVVAVGHKSSAFWSEVVFQKTRQGSVIESKRHSLTLNVLLANKTRDLRYVNVVSFWAWNDHVLNVVLNTNVFI